MPECFTVSRWREAAVPGVLAPGSGGAAPGATVPQKQREGTTARVGILQAVSFGGAGNTKPELKGSQPFAIPSLYQGQWALVAAQEKYRDEMIKKAG